MFLAKRRAPAAVRLVLACVGSGVGAFFCRGQAAEPPAWERVHRQLFTRTDQDGKPYDHEDLEPPLAPGSKFLAEGKSSEQALAALDEFLKGDREKTMTPLQRAVFQRDLWAVLATTAGGAIRPGYRETVKGQILATGLYEDPGDTSRVGRPLRALQRRLVRAMRRVALSPREIAGLPDNLAEAIRSGAFAKSFDPRHPGRAFLPPDLIQPDGGWVGFASGSVPDGLAAPTHTAFVKGRSVFTVYLRLPAGGDVTRSYLKKGASDDADLFTVGTQTALLRRMILIDDAGAPRLTSLTESVELRFYRKPETGKDRLNGGTPAAFVLSREGLYAGRNGGLRPVASDETSVYSFQARGNAGFDPLELPRKPEPVVLLESCRSCHARHEGHGGLHTVATYFAGDPELPRGLVVVSDKEQAEATLRWLRKTYTWGLLQGLWE